MAQIRKGITMNKELILVQELLRAKMINAKREKEAYAGIDGISSPPLFNEWHGQEIAYRQMLDILTKVIGE